MHAVIICDQSLLAIGFAQLLRSIDAGFCVSTVTTVHEALSLLRTMPHVDLVVLDLDTRHCDRLRGACAILRESPHVALTTITSSAMEQEREQAAEIGCCAYLQSKSDLGSLRDAVSGVIGQGPRDFSGIRRA